MGLFISGAATIGVSLIHSYGAGLALRVMTGLGAGVVMSCCTKVISENFEQKDRGIAFGVLLVGPTLGLTVANKLRIQLEDGLPDSRICGDCHRHSDSFVYPEYESTGRRKTKSADGY